MSTFVRRQRTCLSILAATVFACCFTPNLHAAIVVVGTCKSLVQFATIQAAINAVPNNSTIDICSGTYTEQLSINKSLSFVGVANGTADGVVILPPAAGLATNTTSLSSGNPIAAHVWVLGPATVNFTNLIVDSFGNNILACAPDVIGILYQNASGTLNHIGTRNQWVGTSENDTNYNGCQSGLGIYIQSGNSGTSKVTVENSSVHDYQKNGITGNEPGTTLIAMNNDVSGQGSTTGAAENGIQIGFGATGTVAGNLVIDDVWAPDTINDTGDAAAGILLYDTAENSSASVKNNTVGNTQYGIAVVTDTAGLGDGVTVSSNKVFGTRIFDGIDVCTNSNIIQTNTIMNSSESAIHLDASCGVYDGSYSGESNALSANTMIDACTGILADTGTNNNNNIGSNSYFAAGTTTGSSCTPTPSRHPIWSKKVHGTYHNPARP
jgi:hypothetical protein